MSNQVELHPIHDALVLRKSGSELLILASHVSALKSRKTAKDFADYFMGEALVNRPARKLFENWLRKEGDLWRRIFQTVQTMEQSNQYAGEDISESQPAVKTKAVTENKKTDTSDDSMKAKTKTAVKAKEAEPEKKSAKPAAKATPTKPAPAAPTKKAAPKADKKAATVAKKPTKAAAAPVRKSAPARASKKG
jgi:hypothetical protein